MSVLTLNEDCWMLVFQYLDFNDLLTLEKASPLFHDALKLKYRHTSNLDLKLRTLVETGIQTIEEIFPRIGPYIRQFSFSGGYIMDEDLKRRILQNVATYCHNLEILQLNYMKLQREHLEIFEDIIVPQLKQLDLGHCDLHDSDLEPLLMKAQNLQTLFLDGNCELSGKCLVNVTWLKRLEITYCFNLSMELFSKFIMNCKDLKVLDISGCLSLLDDIFEVLNEYQPKLEELYVLDMGVQRNQEVFSKLKHLKVLNITGKRLGT